MSSLGCCWPTMLTMAGDLRKSVTLGFRMKANKLAKSCGITLSKDPCASATKMRSTTNKLRLKGFTAASFDETAQSKYIKGFAAAVGVSEDAVSIIDFQDVTVRRDTELEVTTDILTVGDDADSQASSVEAALTANNLQTNLVANGLTTATVVGTTTTQGFTVSADPAALTVASTSDTSSSGLDGGIIALIVILCLLFCCGIGVMIYCLFFNKGEACSCCSSCADVEGGGCFSGCAGRCCCMAKKTLSSKDANAESVEVQGSASVAASVPGVASQKTTTTTTTSYTVTQPATTTTTSCTVLQPAVSASGSATAAYPQSTPNVGPTTTASIMSSKKNGGDGSSDSSDSDDEIDIEVAVRVITADGSSLLRKLKFDVDKDKRCHHVLEKVNDKLKKMKDPKTDMQIERLVPLWTPTWDHFDNKRRLKKCLKHSTIKRAGSQVAEKYDARKEDPVKIVGVDNEQFDANFWNQHLDFDPIETFKD